MKSLLTCFTCCFFTVYMNAQPSIEWQKCFGGTKSENSGALVETGDGGYIAGGIAYSSNGDVSGVHGDRDVWLIKFDSVGNLIWQRAYGGSLTEDFISIVKTSDGGYIIVGSTWSNDGDVSGFHGGQGADIWVLKIDQDGDIEWQRALGGTLWDMGNRVVETSDGGFLIGGSARSGDGDVSENYSVGKEDIWLVKLDGLGNLEWDVSLGGTNIDILIHLIKTKDGGYILSGSTNSNNMDVVGQHGDWDIWVVKLDSLCGIEWSKTYGGSSYDISGKILETSDGGYLFNGTAYSNNYDVTGNHVNGDAWVVKTNALGAIQWQNALGGSSSDAAWQSYETESGNFIVLANAVSIDGDVTGQHGGGDVWLIQLSEAGNLKWQKTYGGFQSDYGAEFLPTSDGGFLLTGGTESNDADVSGNHGSQDFWVLKFAQNSIGVEDLSSSPGSLEISPNPAKHSIFLQLPEKETSVRVQVYDLMGRLIHVYPTAIEGSIDISSLAGGPYQVVATSASGKTFTNLLWKQP